MKRTELYERKKPNRVLTHSNDNGNDQKIAPPTLLSIQIEGDWKVVPYSKSKNYQF